MIAPEVYTGLNMPYKKQFIGSLHTSQQDKAFKVIGIVCNYFKIEPKDILNQSRKREKVLARQISILFIKQKTTLSLKAIGSLFDGRDHSTVIYALNTVNDLMDTDPKFAKTIATIEDLVSGIRLEETVSTEIPTVS